MSTIRPSLQSSRSPQRTTPMTPRRTVSSSVSEDCLASKKIITHLDQQTGIRRRMEVRRLYQSLFFLETHELKNTIHKVDTQTSRALHGKMSEKTISLFYFFYLWIFFFWCANQTKQMKKGKKATRLKSRLRTWSRIHSQRANKSGRRGGLWSVRVRRRSQSE